MKTVFCYTILIETSPQALPLGAACVASSIRHHCSTKDKFNVLLDYFSMEKLPAELREEHSVAGKIISDEIQKRLEKEQHKIDYILFSVYVWNRHLLETVAANLKNNYPEVIIIAGGPEVTANPTTFKNFDYTISGEGEESVPNLLAALESGKKELPQGVYDCKNPGAVVGRSAAPDLSGLTSPYLDGTIDPASFGGALWELARGCPFKCSYCFESKGEKKVRAFPMERIEKELELFNRKKINQVFVLDPTYNANKKRALELLRLIEKKAPGMFFYFEARAEFIDRELAQAFTRIPCALQFGLQSSNPDVLKYVNRSLDKKLFAKNIGFLNQTGAIFGFDLIYGLPKDNLEGFRRSVDFALELYPNNLETFRLSILPGTALSENAKELGLVYKSEAPYHVVDSDTFGSKDLDKAERISHACNIFYNQGRAVPWFMSIASALKMRPVVLIEEFASFMECKKIDSAKLDNECRDHEWLEKLILEFLGKLFEQRGKKNLFAVAENVVKFNGALSRVSDTGKQQNVKLSYHPDDLASPYASDIVFFTKNCGRHNCNVSVFATKNGPDWKTVK